MNRKNDWFGEIRKQDLFAESQPPPRVGFFRGLFVILQTIAISLILLFFWMPFNVPSYILGVSVGISVVFTCLSLHAEGRSRSAIRPYWPILSLYLLFWISVLYSSDPAEAMRMCGKYLSLLLLPLIFWGMTPRFFSSGRLRIFAFSLVAGCVVEVGLRTGLLAQCFLTVSELEPYRRTGFWTALNEFLSFQGIYMDFSGKKMLMHTTFEALYLNFAFSLTAIGWIKRDRFFRKRFHRVLSGFVLFLLAFTLLTSNSKTGQLLFGATVLLLLCLAFRQRRYILAGSVLGSIFLVVLLVIPYIGKGISGRIVHSVQVVHSVFEHDTEVESDGSALPRIYCWKTAWDIVKEHPVAGVGVGSRSVFEKAFAAKYPDYKIAYNHPHNQFLAILVSNGIIGLLLFLWGWAEAVRLLRRESRMLWWIWLLGMFLVCMTDTFFNNLLGIIYFCGIYGLIVAVHLNRRRTAAAPRNGKSPDNLPE